jgi:hypothetical protein
MGPSIWRVNDSVSQMLGARLHPSSRFLALVSDLSIVFGRVQKESTKLNLVVGLWLSEQNAYISRAGTEQQMGGANI